ERRAAPAARRAVGAGLPGPRSVQAVDLGVADRGEPRFALGSPIDRRCEAAGLPSALAGGPGHGRYASTGLGRTRVWGQRGGLEGAPLVAAGGAVREASGSLTSTLFAERRRTERSSRIASAIVTIGIRRPGSTRRSRSFAAVFSMLRGCRIAALARARSSGAGVSFPLRTAVRRSAVRRS